MGEQRRQPGEPRRARRAQAGHRRGATRRRPSRARARRARRRRAPCADVGRRHDGVTPISSSTRRNERSAYQMRLLTVPTAGPCGRRSPASSAPGTAPGGPPGGAPATATRALRRPASRASPARATPRASVSRRLLRRRRARPHRRAPARVDHRVAGDLVEPGAHARAVGVVAAGMAPRAQEHLLHDLLRRPPLAQGVVGEPVELAGVEAVELRSASPVSSVAARSTSTASSAAWSVRGGHQAGIRALRRAGSPAARARPPSGRPACSSPSTNRVGVVGTPARTPPRKSAETRAATAGSRRSASKRATSRPSASRAGPQVRILEMGLVGEQRVVHRPEGVLPPGRLGGVGGRERARMARADGEVAERDAQRHLAQAQLQRRAERALVVPVDDDQRRVLRAAHVVDGPTGASGAEDRSPIDPWLPRRRREVSDPRDGWYARNDDDGACHLRGHGRRAPRPAVVRRRARPAARGAPRRSGCWGSSRRSRTTTPSRAPRTCCASRRSPRPRSWRAGRSRRCARRGTSAWAAAAGGFTGQVGQRVEEQVGAGQIAGRRRLVAPAHARVGRRQTRARAARSRAGAARRTRGTSRPWARSPTAARSRTPSAP